MSLHPDVGVKYAAYAKFKCTDCNRTWDSCKSWKNYGQECSKCHQFRSHCHMEKLYFYTCPNCGQKWNNKKMDESLCRKCKIPGKMFGEPRDRKIYMEAHFPSEDDELQQLQQQQRAPNGNHKSELCQKCQLSPYKNCQIRDSILEERGRRNGEYVVQDIVNKMEKMEIKAPVTKKLESSGIKTIRSLPTVKTMPATGSRTTVVEPENRYNHYRTYNNPSPQPRYQPQAVQNPQEPSCHIL